MKLINGYWTDLNGNKWHAGIYSLETAIEQSLTLINCTECLDCEKCIDCTNCQSCIACIECQDCEVCVGVSYKANCLGTVACYLEI